MWRWTTSNNLTLEDVQSVLGNKEVTEALYEGLSSYKPNKPEAFSQLQSKYPDQTKLLSVVQTLQNYLVSVSLNHFYTLFRQPKAKLCLGNNPFSQCQKSA